MIYGIANPQIAQEMEELLVTGPAHTKGEEGIPEPVPITHTVGSPAWRAEAARAIAADFQIAKVRTTTTRKELGVI